MKKTEKGFTLLELLVVIGIISMLVGVLSVSYNAMQKRGRDSRRRSDIRAVQEALEQYYVENTYVYPTGDCSGAGEYIKGAWPVVDPSGENYEGMDACASTSYCICTLMEVEDTGNSVNDSCSWSGGSLDYYCVTSLQ